MGYNVLELASRLVRRSNLSKDWRVAVIPPGQEEPRGQMELLDLILNNAVTVTKTANYTVVAADSGTWILVDMSAAAADVVLTLPAALDGMVVKVLVTGLDASATFDVRIDPAATDKIVGQGNAGVANKDLINEVANTAIGDLVVLNGGASNDWYIQDIAGTWDPEA